MSTVLVSPDFYPGISGKLYLIRRGLYHGIALHAGMLTGRMMDFGCGQKPYRRLFSNVTEYVGVDFEGEGHSHHDEQIDVFYDGKTIPFPDNNFDSVLSTEVFEHIFNLEEVLKEIHRVMRPGAKLLFTCPFVWGLHEVPVDFARYTPYAIRHLLERNGFKVLSVEKTGNALEAINQLRILEGPTRLLNNKITRKLGIGQLFDSLYTIWVNASTYLKSKSGLFQKNTALYMNNVVLAEKNEY
jgi:SAM-dependent methyltransferase